MIYIGLIVFAFLAICSAFFVISQYQTIQGKIAGVLAFIFLLSPTQGYIGEWWSLLILLLLVITAILFDNHFEKKGGNTE